MVFASQYIVVKIVQFYRFFFFSSDITTEWETLNLMVNDIKNTINQGDSNITVLDSEALKAVIGELQEFFDPYTEGLEDAKDLVNQVNTFIQNLFR